MSDSVSSTVVLALAVVVLVLWIWSRRQGSHDAGDFERRIQEMQRTGATPGAPPPSAPAPTLSVGAERTSAGRMSGDTIDDPVLGPLRYFDDQEGGEWEREGAEEIGLTADAWVTVLAGPEGPTDSQRACYQAFATDHGGIIARAELLAREAYVSRKGPVDVLEAGNLYVYRVASSEARATGAIVFSPPEEQTDYVSVASDDHWKTLRVEDE